MAKKGSDNILLWLALLGGGLFYVYHRHGEKEDEGTGPTATPAATGPHRYIQTALPPHNYHAPPPAHQLPPIIPPSGFGGGPLPGSSEYWRSQGQGMTNPFGFGSPGGCSTCPPAFSGFTYAPGDRVRSWFDADAHAGMYAVPMENSYGDVGSLF